MPNGREHLNYDDFGGHAYSKHGTSDCTHGCGCSAGSTMSYSRHAGVDPLGKCPANILLDNDRIPKGFGGKPLGQEEILKDFVDSRIKYLSEKVRLLEPYEKTVKAAEVSSKVWLQLKVEELEQEHKNLERKLIAITEGVQVVLKKAGL